MRRSWAILACLSACLVGGLAAHAVSEATVLANLESAYRNGWVQGFGGNSQRSRRAAKAVAKAISDAVPSTESGDNRSNRMTLVPIYCDGAGISGGPFRGYTMTAAADLTCYFHWIVPEDFYAAGDAVVITPTGVLSAKPGGSTDDIVVGLCMDSATTGEPGTTCTVDTSVTVTLASTINVNDYWRGTEMVVPGSALGSGLSVGDSVMIRIRRLGTDGSDDYAGSWHINGIELRYTSIPYGS